MAIQFHDVEPTLTQKVMNTLGLTEEWFDTDEAKKILLGKEVTYDAVEGGWVVETDIRRPAHVI
jgi:hypothetical protein